MALRPLYYDTETTGIASATDRVVEIAVFDPERDRSYCSFINPGQPIPPEATAIHHITNEMVADAPSFAEATKELIAFCEGETVLIAHNNDAFDIHFLRAEFKRAEVEMPQWRFLDSLKWARRYRPDLPRHSLQFLREIYGFDANNAHRALDDVIVLSQVFEALIDDLSMDKVFELMNTPRLMHSMPFGKHRGKALKSLPKNYIEWLAQSGALDKDENQELKSSLVALDLV